MNAVCALGILILGAILASKSKGSLIGKFDAAPTKQTKYQQPDIGPSFSQSDQQDPQVDQDVNPLGDIYDIIS